MKNCLPRTALLISCLLLLLSGCKPVQMVGGSSSQTHDRDHSLRQIDSVLIVKTDSVFIREKGDTVYMYRYRTLYQDRWRDRTDTLIVRDSIATETPVMVYKTTGWQNFQLWCGRILLALLLGYFLFRLIKRHLKPF